MYCALWWDLTGMLLSVISDICSVWLVLPLGFIYWWSFPLSRCLYGIEVSGLEFSLPPPYLSHIVISIYLLSMRLGYIWVGGVDYCRIEILRILYLVCGIILSLLGVFMWCSHSYRYLLAPEYVCTLGFHRVICFLDRGENMVLRICLFGCLMGYLKLEEMCKGRGIRCTGIGLM